MTDISLIRPVGEFYWEAKLNGELCLCEVTWDCSYVGDGPVAIPPRVSIFNEYIVVSPRLEPGVPVPALVTPGVLTLTPTTTCPTSDPESPLVTIWDPIYLTITEFGLSSSGGSCVDVLPTIPDNPGFETGSLSPWTGTGHSVVSSFAHAGAYSCKLSAGNLLSQTVASLTFCPNARDLKLQWYAYADGVDGAITAEWELRNSLDQLIYSRIQSDLVIAKDAWRLFNYTTAVPTATLEEAKSMVVTFITGDSNVYVDSVSVTITIT